MVVCEQAGAAHVSSDSRDETCIGRVPTIDNEYVGVLEQLPDELDSCALIRGEEVRHALDAPPLPVAVVARANQV